MKYVLLVLAATPALGVQLHCGRDQYERNDCTDKLHLFGRDHQIPRVCACDDVPSGHLHSSNFYRWEAWRQLHQCSCQPCQQDWSSVEGSASCKQCGAGTYVTKTWDRKAHCEPCAAGKFTGDQNLHACHVCSTGRFSHQGWKLCEACAAGKYNPYTGQSGCWQCPTGKYQNHFGQSVCANLCGNQPVRRRRFSSGRRVYGVEVDGTIQHGRAV
jgi:hypothetical protein